MKRETPFKKGGAAHKKRERKHEEAGKKGGFGTGLSTEKAPWKAGLKAAKASVQEIGGAKPELSFIVVNGDYNLSALLKGVSKGNGGATIVGVRPHGFAFSEEDIVEEGIMVASIGIDALKFVVGLGEGVSKDLEKAVEEAITPIVDQIPIKRTEGYEHMAIFFVVDSIRNGDVMLSVFSRILDNKANEILPFVGAVLDITGQITEEVGIIYEGEMHRDAILTIGIFSKYPLGSGYGHGLYPLVPKRATQVSGNVIVQLDGRPAYNVWRDYLVRKGYELEDIEADPGKYLSRYLFGIPDVANPRYPKVRMALGITEDGGIKLSGSVKENSTIWFMEARKERMIKAAGDAIVNAVEGIREGKPAGAIVLSSLVRFLNLKDDYFDEIEAIRRKLDIPFIGFNTAGEFYRPTSTMKWFHNSSVVTLVIPE